VNISLDYSGIDAQLTPLDDLFLLGDGYQSPMQLLHRFRPQLPRQPSHRLIVRNFTAADACELPIDEIGAHLPLQLVKTPIEHVFERQQAQHYFGWGAFPATRLALLTAFG
jgi:hypothetical protein